MLDNILLDESSYYNKDKDTWGDVFYGRKVVIAERDKIRMKRRLTRQQIYEVEHPHIWDIRLAFTPNDDKKLGEDSYKKRYVIIYPEDEKLKDIAVIPILGSHEANAKKTFWSIPMIMPEDTTDFLFKDKMLLGIGVLNDVIINDASVYRIDRELLTLSKGVLDDDNQTAIIEAISSAKLNKVYLENGYK